VTEATPSTVAISFMCAIGSGSTIEYFGCTTSRSTPTTSMPASNADAIDRKSPNSRNATMTESNVSVVRTRRRNRLDQIKEA